MLKKKFSVGSDELFTRKLVLQLNEVSNVVGYMTISV